MLCELQSSLRYGPLTVGVLLGADFAFQFIQFDEPHKLNESTQLREIEMRISLRNPLADQCAFPDDFTHTFRRSSPETLLLLRRSSPKVDGVLLARPIHYSKPFELWNANN
jgi:hypothetical protein